MRESWRRRWRDVRLAGRDNIPVFGTVCHLRVSVVLSIKMFFHPSSPEFALARRIAASLATDRLPAHIAAASVTTTQASCAEPPVVVAVAVHVFIWIVFIPAVVRTFIERSNLPHEAAHATTMHRAFVACARIVWSFGAWRLTTITHGPSRARASHCRVGTWLFSTWGTII